MSSDYLKYFTLDKDNFKARCKLCPDHKRNVFSFSKSSKTNLKTHISTAHSDDVKKIQEEEKKTNPFLLCSLSSEEQSRITDAVVDFVIEADEPIALPEKPAFRKLMKKVKPTWKPISRKTCRAKIIQKGKPFTYNHAEYKRKYGKPSGTVDVWTSRRRVGYMAFTLHLQNKHRSFPKVLDVRYIPSPHNAENIAKCYHSILGDYGLSPDDLFKVVCDNASNMKKAFKVSLWEADGNGDVETDILREADLDEFEIALDANEEFQDLIFDFMQMFREQYRVPCTIHTLQLLVKDIIAALPVRHKQVLARAKVACKKQHQSVRLSEQTDYVLPAHSETRWNGQLKLLTKIEKEFEDVLAKFGTFMSTDKSYVSALCWLLTPMQRMTSRIEGDHLATIHHVIPNLCGIERHLLSVPTQNASFYFSQNFSEQTLNLLEKRFGFVVEDEHLLAAAVLSPHGLKWVSSAPRKALKFGSYEQIMDIVRNYMRQQIAAIPAEDLPQHRSVGSHTFDQDCDFGYEQPTNVTTATLWEQEFSDHLLRVATMTPDQDPVAYWKAQPTSAFTIVAIQILNVPASSAPVERVFSLCGNICTDTRTRMGPDLLSALVRAKFNNMNENHILDT